MWLLHIRPHQRGLTLLAFPAAAVLALLTPLTTITIEPLALLLVALVAVSVTLGRRTPDPVA